MEKQYQIFLVSIFTLLGLLVISFFIPSEVASDSSSYVESAEANISSSILNKDEDYQLSIPKTSAKSFLVADLDSGFVFTEKNFENKFPIASITKLMTSIIVVENLDLNESILVTKEMLDVYGSTKGIEEGEILKAGNLIYPLLIESSNGAGEILSYFLGKEKFVNLMNEKAKLILMEKTNFTDSHGLSIENVSTVQDIFQLIRYIFINHPYLLEIGKGKIAGDFEEVTFDLEELWNRNVFNVDPNFIGGKTGYLPEAKNTAIFVFQFIDENKNNRNVAIILLASDGLKNDTQRIYKWLMDNYSLSSVYL